MNIRKPFLAAACLFLVLSAAAGTGGFDEARFITGSVDRLIEINTHRIIENVDPDTVGLPRSFVIDLEERTMRGTSDSLVRRMISIQHLEHIGHSLILQGTDEGTPGTADILAWSLVIDKKTGQAVLSAAGSGIAWTAFGSCAPSTAAE